MFMVFSKDKIISYLVSIGTVAFLFVISFAMTKNNEEIIKTSANIIKTNECIENVIMNETAINSIENSLSNTLKNK